MLITLNVAYVYVKHISLMYENYFLTVKRTSESSFHQHAVMRMIPACLLLLGHQ